MRQAVFEVEMDSLDEELSFLEMVFDNFNIEVPQHVQNVLGVVRGTLNPKQVLEKAFGEPWSEEYKT